MVKVQHKGEIVGHTFISIGYQSFDLRGVFSIVVRNIRFALKLPDESNMPKSPAISHKIENIFVDWQGAFVSLDPPFQFHLTLEPSGPPTTAKLHRMYAECDIIDRD